MIISQNCNGVHYAYFNGRFWRWDESAHVWKESHLLAQKFGKAKTVEKRLTPEAFLTSDEFIPMDDYELPEQMLTALRDAKPCKNAPIEPVEEESSSDVPAPCICSTCTCGGCKEECFGNCRSCGQPVQECNSYQTGGEKHLTPAHSEDVAEPFGNIPSAPGFDFGADDQTNALLLQDAQTFITGNMARIMAAKHAHNLTANHYKGSWGKWCAAVGISRDTGDNMVRVAEQFGNIQLEGKSILDVQPMKLLYAAAKPSTPQEIKQSVFTGDIRSFKEYQDAIAQFKAEKERADEAESHYKAALSDLNGLTEQNSQLRQSFNKANDDRIAARLQCQKAESERDKAETRAQDLEKQLEGSRQVAEAAKLRGDKLKAENDALKKQPITAVIDEEEVDKRAGEKAYQIAADMTADLRQQLEQATSGNEQEARSSYDNVLLADRSFQNIGKMVVPSLRKLPPEQREQLTNMLIRTLGQIQGEVSKCL